MRIYDIIQNKRDGHELSTEEIEFFVEGYTKGEIPDYQISALLMAIYLKQMNTAEIVALTNAMVKSGDTVDLSSIKGVKVDKHSTGGVGDKTTLVLGPMVAACGLPVVKMSGRGLGHTGGTLDKLDAIEGFNTVVSKEDFIDIVNEINICISGQTANIAPADKKFYALRDVTATVDSLALIASSIMSKKLALLSDAIVLDVKLGSGAFMKDINHAIELAKNMVNIGEEVGRKTVGVITNMDEPLGFAIGNALEVIEAIETLEGNGPKDLVDLCLELGGHMLVLGKKADSIDDAKKQLRDVIENGKALEKLKELVEKQGGDVSFIEDKSKLPTAKHKIEVKSEKNGFIQFMNAEDIGKYALELGAGRETKDSEIDLAVGIVLKKKVDDKVSVGDVLAVIHTDDLEKGKSVAEKLKKTMVVGDKNSEHKKLIYGIITKDSETIY